MMAVESQSDGVMLDWLLAGMTRDSVPALPVTGIQTDSREVRPGDLFLACAGLQVHGLNFRQQALDNGAVAIAWEPVDALSPPEAVVPVIAIDGLSERLGLIADRYYGQPSANMHVIGVTGTDGKTSVTYFMAQALMPDGDCGLLGTLGYGVYGELHVPTHTTPDALRLQMELARLYDTGVKQVVMEVSSHALHQQRVAGVAFHTAVLTQLSRDHLDYHGSIEAYAEAKRRLFTHPGLRAVVINADDEFGRQLITQLQGRVQLLVYGRACRQLANDWIEMDAVTSTAQGIELQLSTSRGEARLNAAVLGEFNGENLVAALGALLLRGIPLDDAVQRLQRVQAAPGRMELLHAPGVASVVIDYAHTPHALESVLQALRPHCRGELICVFGAGGDRDSGKRPQLGEVAERYADRTIITNDNPRGEDPRAIADAIISGFSQPQRATCILDRGLAIEAAIAAAGADDLVLIAGKGHEEYQQLGDRRMPFSDRDSARLALRRRGG